MAKMQNTINKLRRLELWVCLAFFLLLSILSIFGAFLSSDLVRKWLSQEIALLSPDGAGKWLFADVVKRFFNSPPLVIFWLLFLSLLIAGLLTFPRLLRKPGLLMIHLGCVSVLLGAMWSSDQGHFLQGKLLGINKIPRGNLVIEEGTQNNIVVDDSEKEVGHLPFTVWLEDFWIVYHWDEGVLHVRQGRGQTRHLSARVGEELELPEPLGRLKILRILTNLKVADRITDRPRDRINPALEIEIEWADGSKRSAYAFPPDMPHPMRMEDFEFVYEPNEHILPKDYYSDLVVLDYVNKVQKRQVIEVNKPLHYNGYHFYQSSFGPSSPFASRQWTVLGVVSDSGLSVVFTGYILLGAGIFWHCWLRHISSYFRKRNK